MPPPADSESLFDDAEDDLFGDSALPTRSGSPIDSADFDESLTRLGRQLPRSVRLGTSSWNFPGWRDLVWRNDPDAPYSESQLARHGLGAYARHPLLRCVGIDRSFYQPLTVAEYARYADQVPSDFRFVVKAPAMIADAVMRGKRGEPIEANPLFLDASATLDHFVAPALEGLGSRTGPLLLQVSPMPREMTTGEAGIATIERIGALLTALPSRIGETTALYAIELRNAELLTPRLVRTLRECGARLCIALHPRMPAAARQSAALRSMDALESEGDDWRMKGALVARWTLAGGMRYEDARVRYAPFNRLVDPDIPTRGTLAHLIHVAIKSEQPSFIIANNKAEGSAPLTLVELAKAVVA
ncbi:MAG: DUF72 domain-containing protein [Burkholderiaceae bacterium]|nr:DUF72 domain-containing protein [Burkholderiaceae bacterium]